MHSISDVGSYTKTLGLEWNTTTDMFNLTISESPPPSIVTKRALGSDIAKVFDALGWFSPATITMKILLQRLWESKVDWDDSVQEEIEDTWRKWRSELSVLSTLGIPRCYLCRSGLLADSGLCWQRPHIPHYLKNKGFTYQEAMSRALWRPGPR